MLSVSSIVWYRQPHKYDIEHGGFTHSNTLVLLRKVRRVRVGVVEEKSTFAKDQGENEW